MKKLLLQFLMLLVPFVAISQIFVPDDNFEQALIDLGYDSGPLDNLVTFSNIASVTSLDISSKGISDLTGINGFPSLQTLYCNDNQLTTINLSNNAQLRDLRLNDNSLVFISLSNLTQLEIFSANNNQLTSLNVSFNPALVALSVSQNNLTSLDTSSNPFLVQIICDRNQLTSLTVDTFSDLRELYCYENQLTSLDVTTNSDLEILWCRSNQLTSINTTGITNLKTYVAYSNQLTSVDVSTNTGLDLLSLGGNNLSSINISNNLLLTELYLGDNQLTTVDVTSSPLLKEFWCQRNQINTVNTSGLSILKTYVAYDNQLTSVDVSTNTGLDLLSLGTNSLSAINISNNTLLTELYLSRNQLTTIDLQPHSSLEKLGIFDNQLTTINLTNNSNLQVADIGTNDYTSIDLSVNTLLTEIYVQNCPNLEELNVKNGANTNLTNFSATSNPNLSCIEVDDPVTSAANWVGVDSGTTFNTDCNYGNVYVPDDAFEQALIDLGYDTAPLDDYAPTDNINIVTNLDISNLGIVDMTGIEGFVALETLNCSGNAITSIDISANTVLTSLDVSQNELTSLNLNNLSQLNEFDGSNNNFFLLAVKNGNNTNFTNFDATNNPELICIEVDDVAYSTANWTNIDTQTSFNTDCGQFYTYVPDDIFEQTLIDLGYDSGALNDYVLTANINTITILDVREKGIADLTGINDFIALEELNCSRNILTSLDIRANANLEVLICSFNLIPSIDVTNNAALRTLSVWSNLLTSLDVNNNSLLEYLDLETNAITSLDISQNPQLFRLFAANNSLEQLNAKNGNNTNFITFSAYGNPMLTCIEVDDAVYSTANWISIDSQASFSENCNYDFTYVPDDAFEQALIDLGYDTAPLDDFVLTTTIETVTTLNISNKGITDLTGIEGFTALEELNCGSNTLPSLNISNNVNLTSLDCASNSLTTIELQNNPNLTELDISANMFTEINVLNTPLLEAINISNNTITILNVSYLTALSELEADNNSLQVLNVKNGNNTNFTNFSTTGNSGLTCIEVDNAAWSTTNWTNIDAQTSYNEDCGYGTYVPDDNFEQALIDVGLDSGPLDDFVPTANINTVQQLFLSNKGISDLTGLEDFIALTFLDCSRNTLTSLNVSYNTNLSNIRCEENDLTYLNVNTPALQYLTCYYNELTTLDLSNNPLLTSLRCSRNDLTNINLNAPLLTYLSCELNSLRSLDLSSSPLLETLDAQSNELKNLDLNANTALVDLYLDGNQLKELELTNHNSLVDLDCGTNYLATLNIENATSLTDVYLSYNYLNSIDLSTNVNLEKLFIVGNNLNSLDLTNTLNLITISARTNNLTSLDVSNNTNLTFVDIADNDLTSLNLKNGNNTNISSFDATNNPSLYCILVDDVAWSTTNWTDIDAQTSFNETSCDYIELGAKVLLQGASLNPNVGEEALMRDDLRVNGLISATSPYGDGATASVIVRSDDNAGNSMVDWVWVELRGINNPTNIIAAQSGILQRDGDIVATDDNLTTPLTFDGLPVAKYHVVVKHRNHLGVMTASSITLKQATTTVDFTDATNQITYGSNAQTTFGMQTNMMGMWSGNVNGDTIVQYSGTSPDTPSILSTVLNDPGNFLNFPTYSISGYNTNDVNMDGSTQYSGTNPDTPIILQNVLAHPGNFLNFSTFQIIEQLPEND